MQDWNIIEKNKPKEGTLLAQRDAEANRNTSELGRPLTSAQPLQQEGRMLCLDEFLTLTLKPSVRRSDLVQCKFGAKAAKPTTRIAEFSDASGLCNHVFQTWLFPSNGTKFYAPRPTLMGKEWA